MEPYKEAHEKYEFFSSLCDRHLYQVCFLSFVGNDVLHLHYLIATPMVILSCDLAEAQPNWSIEMTN